MSDLKALDNSVERSPAVQDYWRGFCVATGLAPATPYQAWYFGDTAELAHELVELVLHGPKRATAGLSEFSDQMPQVNPVAGGYSVLTERDGTPRAVIRTTVLEQRPFCEVDASFAWDEGEGDRTLADWKDGHRRFFTRELALLGRRFDESMAVDLERFEVLLYPFEGAAIEKLIRQRFGPIPAPLLAKPRPAYPVPDHPGTRYAVATDPELPAASLTIFNKLPIREQATILSYRERIIDHLYAAMFNARLNELSQRADAPFIGAGVDRGIFVRTKEVAMLSAMTQPDRIGRALEAMLTEAARVERHGFTASELEREKRNLLRVYDQALAENHKDESAPLAAECIRNFLTGGSLPGIAWEHQMHVRFLPGITLAEVNAQEGHLLGAEDCRQIHRRLRFPQRSY